MFRTVFFVLLFVVMTFNNVNAFQAGVKAPKLEIYEWKQGTKFTLKKTDNERLSVIVFWTTWSPLCRESTEVLNSVYDSFKDLADFAVIFQEKDYKYILSYARKFNLKMALAVDDESRTVQAYMGRNLFFPFVFIIDYEGKVLWSGDLADSAVILEKIRNDEFDLTLEKKLSALQRRLRDEVRANDFVNMLKTAKLIIALNPNDPLAAKAISYVFMTGNKFEKGMALTESLIKKYPKSYTLRFLKFEMMYRAKKPVADIIKVCAETADDFKENIQVLNRLFWLMVYRYDLDKRPIVFLNQLKNKISLLKDKEVKNYTKAEAFEIEARMAYFLGDINSAFKYQTQAVELYKNAPIKQKALNIRTYYSEILKLRKK